MGNHAKLALILLRTVSVLSVGMGFLGFCWFGLAAVGLALPGDVAERLSGTVWYVIVGVILLVLSRPLARLIARGLDEPISN